MIIVSDDFPGIANAIEKFFPDRDHLVLHTSSEVYLCFLKYPENLRKHIYTTNPVESINSMIERARINLGGYFQSSVRSISYTTSACSLVNPRGKIAVQPLCWDSWNILVQRDILKKNKWSKPVPALKGSSYEVLQIFNRIFCYETQNYWQVSNPLKL